MSSENGWLTALDRLFAPQIAGPTDRRILMVTEALARGGAERQMLALTRGLRDRGLAVGVVELLGTVPGQANFNDEFAAHGIVPRCVTQFPCSEPAEHAGSAIGKLREFARILPRRWEEIAARLAIVMQQFEPTAIYCWSDAANLIGGFVGVQERVPLIILGQRTFPPPFWVDADAADLYRRAYRTVLRESNMIMVNISTTSADAYSSWLGTHQPIKVIRNGFDPISVTVPASRDATEFRRGLGIGDDSPVVGTVMRFAPEKDPVLWLQTAAIIAAARPDVHFILNGYGHGDIATQLRALGDRLGLTDRLHMPADIVEVGLVYDATTVFLMTSRTEATPNALIEAQACGIPVIAPAVGGIAEAMLDQITGAIVRVRSADALAAAVLAVLNDPSWASRAKAWGPRFIADRFGLTRMIDETAAIWE